MASYVGVRRFVAKLPKEEFQSLWLVIIISEAHSLISASIQFLLSHNISLSTLANLVSWRMTMVQFCLMK